MSSGPSSIGDLLLKRREARGWEQPRVAEELDRVGHNVSQDWLYKVEAGRLKDGKPQKPGVELLGALAKVYKLDLDEFLTWLRAADISPKTAAKVLKFPKEFYYERRVVLSDVVDGEDYEVILEPRSDPDKRRMFNRATRDEEQMATEQQEFDEFLDAAADEGVKRLLQLADAPARERKVFREQVSRDTKLKIAYLIQFLIEYGPEHDVTPTAFNKPTKGGSDGTEEE